MDEAAHAAGGRSCRLPRPPVGWRGRQRLVRPRTPSVERSAKRRSCGAEGRLGCRHAEGHGAWHRDHIWTGTRYADLDRLRRARAGSDRGSGAVMVEKLTIVVDAGTVVDPDGALGAGRGPCPLGSEYGIARRVQVRPRSGEVHEPRHLYAFTHRRRAPRSMSSLLIAKRFPSASASRRRPLWVPPSAMQSSLPSGPGSRPTYPSVRPSCSKHSRARSQRNESADDDRGWAALALRGGLHSPDELLHSGERLRRVLWSDNFPDRCRNFPVTRLKIPCLASTGNFVLIH